MAAVMIGAGPHKASHTAVAISAAEEPLGELRVRASVAQAGRPAGLGCGVAAADLGSRGRRRHGPPAGLAAFTPPEPVRALHPPGHAADKEIELE